MLQKNSRSKKLAFFRGVKLDMARAKRYCTAKTKAVEIGIN